VVRSPWFVLMPQGPSTETIARYRQVGVLNPRRMGIEALIEEGGIATGAEIRLQEKPAGLRGTVLDSAGRPLAGATVRLAGTALRGPVDKQGRFTIDTVLPGLFGSGRPSVVCSVRHGGRGVGRGGGAEQVSDVTGRPGVCGCRAPLWGFGGIAGICASSCSTAVGHDG
jgi:hypothetical protein